LITIIVISQTSIVAQDIHGVTSKLRRNDYSKYDDSPKETTNDKQINSRREMQSWNWLNGGSQCSDGNVGDQCSLVCACKDPNTCGVKELLCRGPGTEGASCHAARPCSDGFECKLKKRKFVCTVEDPDTAWTKITDNYEEAAETIEEFFNGEMPDFFNEIFNGQIPDFFNENIADELQKLADDIGTSVQDMSYDFRTNLLDIGDFFDTDIAEIYTDLQNTFDECWLQGTDGFRPIMRSVIEAGPRCEESAVVSSRSSGLTLAETTTSSPPLLDTILEGTLSSIKCHFKTNEEVSKNLDLAMDIGASLVPVLFGLSAGTKYGERVRAALLLAEIICTESWGIDCNDYIERTRGAVKDYGRTARQTRGCYAMISQGSCESKGYSIIKTATRCEEAGKYLAIPFKGEVVRKWGENRNGCFYEPATSTLSRLWNNKGDTECTEVEPCLCLKKFSD